MLTLTTKELTEITGRSQPAAQVRWLTDRSWIFEIGLDGLPKVATAYFEKRMVLGVETEPAITPPLLAQGWQVNTDALRQPTNI